MFSDQEYFVIRNTRQTDARTPRGRRLNRQTPTHLGIYLNRHMPTHLGRRLNRQTPRHLGRRLNRQTPTHLGRRLNRQTPTHLGRRPHTSEDASTRISSTFVQTGLIAVAARPLYRAGANTTLLLPEILTLTTRNKVVLKTTSWGH